jgi:hypothetical protein
MNARKTGTRGRPAKPAAKSGAAKKTTAKKPAAKTTTRKPATRKPAARNTSKRTSAKTSARQTRAPARTKSSARGAVSYGSIIASAKNKNLDTRRPEDNTLPPASSLLTIMNNLDSLKMLVEQYAQHMRPLDRRRLNGVGIKKLGFIETAYELAVSNQEFLPHWLSINKFDDDNGRFNTLKIIMSLSKQIEELLWNITIESADILYTDALEFYQSVQSAAKRRVDAAEALFNELRVFFTSRGSWSQNEDAPTEKQAQRDFTAVLHGRRDGEVAVRNVRPKLTAGKREVIDKKFTDTEQFKETEEAEIKE